MISLSLLLPLSLMLMQAGIDSLAHGIRDKDLDDEAVAMFKQRPGLVLIPNLPDRGVKVDRSWMRPGMSASCKTLT